MANERILISENAEVIKLIDQAYENEKASLLAKANTMMAWFSEFDETFNETGTTTSKYNQIISIGVQPYIDAAINKIKDEFTTVGITSSAVLAVATERTEQRGDGLIKAYNELLHYLEVPAKYPALKFALSDVKFVNGLAAVNAEKDLEPLKDTKARNFIDTAEGYELIEKAEVIAAAMNSLNDYLGSKKISQIITLEDLRDFVDYKISSDNSIVQLEVNYKDIHYLSRKMGTEATSQ